MSRLISLPPESIINFYYYYSTIFLIICWLIAPLLFYIIFTQSKKLNSVKWLILNHSFWCLALETLLGLVKPLFLLPCAGGIQIGIFKDFGDFRNTAASALICLLLIASCICGLTMTISSRYLYVYPSKLTKYFTLKFNIKFMIGLTILLYLLGTVTFYSIFFVQTETIHQWAMEYDPILTNFFHEPSFFLVPHSILDQIVAAVLSLLGGIMLLFILLSIFFIFQICKNQSVSTTRFQKSLILSSIMQIYLTILFLILPMFMFFVFITFDIPNSASAMCLLTCLIMTHCLAEFIVTLYCISPYRRFIMTYFKKPVNRNISVQNVSGIMMGPRSVTILIR